MKFDDIWNDKFPPLNLYNCPNTHKYEQLVLGRTFKTVDNIPVETKVDKIKVPISERIASKIISEHPKLVGVILEKKTLFYDEGGNEPVLELVQRVDEVSGQSYTSYSAYMNKYVQKEYS